MKKIYLAFIIALCLSLMVLPALAANDEKGAGAAGPIKTVENNGPSHDGKTGQDGYGEQNRSATQVREVSRADTPNQQGGRNTTADTPRYNQQTPVQKNQSAAEHGAILKNESAIPTGWVKNPNTVRDAVQSLLAIENRSGGIGPQVSAIAREFNNSENAAKQYEIRITNRDAFTLFFFGGDREAAAGLATITAQNQARIGEIENLMNTTTLDAETRSMLEEQIQLLQKNVAYNQQIATKAKQDRGIFG
ncbi:MAG: hypothetical protein WC586_03730 [Methanoregula sp.]